MISLERGSSIWILTSFSKFKLVGSRRNCVMVDLSLNNLLTLMFVLDKESKSIILVSICVLIPDVVSYQLTNYFAL